MHVDSGLMFGKLFIYVHSGHVVAVLSRFAILIRLSRDPSFMIVHNSVFHTDLLDNGMQF